MTFVSYSIRSLDHVAVLYKYLWSDLFITLVFETYLKNIELTSLLKTLYDEVVFKKSPLINGVAN